MAHDVHQQIKELMVRQTVLEQVQAELDKINVTYTVETAPEGFRLNLSTGLQMVLANLTEKAMRVDRAEWPTLVAAYVEQAQSQPTPPEHLSADDLRARVHTRLISDTADEWDNTSTYARPFAPGVVQVLCVDYPQMVATLPDKTVDKLALPLVELWQYGQANTDAEPIDEQSELDDHVSLLAGDSFFVASKVANFPVLIRDIIGSAPCGVIFAIPNRSLVLYSVVSPTDGMVQLIAMCQTVGSLVNDSEFVHPGGVISTRVFYWAPEGTIEHIASPRAALVDGQPTTMVFPSDTFQHYVPLADRNQ